MGKNLFVKLLEQENTEIPRKVSDTLLYNLYFGKDANVLKKESMTVVIQPDFWGDRKISERTLLSMPVPWNYLKILHNCMKSNSFFRIPKIKNFIKKTSSVPAKYSLNTHTYTFHILES